MRYDDPRRIRRHWHCVCQKRLASRCSETCGVNRAKIARFGVRLIKRRLRSNCHDEFDACGAPDRSLLGFDGISGGSEPSSSLWGLLWPRPAGLHGDLCWPNHHDAAALHATTGVLRSSLSGRLVRWSRLRNVSVRDVLPQVWRGLLRSPVLSPLPSSLNGVRSLGCGDQWISDGFRDSVKSVGQNVDNLAKDILIIGS